MKKMKPIWSKKSYEKNKAKRKRDQSYSDRQKSYRKDYYQKNKERLKKKSREWCVENKERRQAYEREWYNNNKSYLKDYRQQRRAKQIDDAFSRYHQYLQTLD